MKYIFFLLLAAYLYYGFRTSRIVVKAMAESLSKHADLIAWSEPFAKIGLYLELFQLAFVQSVIWPWLYFRYYYILHRMQKALWIGVEESKDHVKLYDIRAFALDSKGYPTLPMTNKAVSCWMAIKDATTGRVSFHTGVDGIPGNRDKQYATLAEFKNAAERTLRTTIPLEFFKWLAFEA